MLVYRACPFRLIVLVVLTTLILWPCCMLLAWSKLLQRYRKRETYLEVNLGHVNEFRPQLLDMLTLKPVEYLPLFEQASGRK